MNLIKCRIISAFKLGGELYSPPSEIDITQEQYEKLFLANCVNRVIEFKNPDADGVEVPTEKKRGRPRKIQEE